MKGVQEWIERRSIPVPECGCWLYDGVVNNNGYGRVGRISADGKKRWQTIHRMSYETYKGEIPSGCLVLHSCDVRSCVNPAHLRLGNQSENIKEMWERGRRSRKPREA